MLVLSRKPGDTVHIGSDVVVKVVDARKGQVKLLFEAPREVPIMRGELLSQRNVDQYDEEDTGFSLTMLGA